MKEKPNFTIVYVFGPAICAKKYKEDQLLSRETGEWVKIGETELSANIEDITIDEYVMDNAMKRIHQEPRTGIPVICEVYDVFIFPYQIGTDNYVRRRLCSELFDIENSKKNNEKLEDGKYQIKAGVEFVYGVTRSKILYAVQSVDHELLAKEVDDEKIKTLVRLCRFNQKNLDNTSKEEKSPASGQKKAILNLDLILEVGAEVILTKDGSKTVVVDNIGDVVSATYIGGNRFECRGETGRSSYFAKKYLETYAGKKMQTVNGNEYWTYNGQKLTLLRKN
ncbi:MAG: hypothetical protein IKX44_08315 [Prevotella sp.]|nr:hypothetical protein [Prevotella sp.]